MSHLEHKEHAVAVKARVQIVTVSSSRYKQVLSGATAEDPSGKLAKERLTAFGHKVERYLVIPDNIGQVVRVLLEGLKLGLDATVLIGGTGVSPTDITVDAFQRLATRLLPGFSDRFHALSSERVGTASIVSRACAGFVGDHLVICLPGSKDAVEVGLFIILPELSHLIHHAKEACS
ncbi:MogA/MoaB family molybdenum cofactor biosynthesis protein [archaeon]|nr:MogA/MoaB family molybdenum cofactor biosynthesis protein [archaeon]